MKGIWQREINPFPGGGGGELDHVRVVGDEGDLAEGTKSLSWRGRRGRGSIMSGGMGVKGSGRRN